MTLKTDRLLLRPFELTDVDDVYANARPVVPETVQVLAMSQFGVLARDVPTASHHSRNCCRVRPERSVPPLSRVLSNWASRTCILPLGCHWSSGATLTSHRPTMSVRRCATVPASPWVKRTQRGRLPRMSLPKLPNQSVAPACVIFRLSCSSSILSRLLAPPPKCVDSRGDFATIRHLSPCIYNQPTRLTPRPYGLQCEHRLVNDPLALPQ